MGEESKFSLPPVHPYSIATILRVNPRARASPIIGLATIVKYYSSDNRYHGSPYSRAPTINQVILVAPRTCRSLVPVMYYSVARNNRGSPTIGGASIRGAQCFNVSYES